MPVDNQEIAERVMYELLGHRWVWPAVSARDAFENPRERIHLPGRPVISVESVTLNGEAITGWRLENLATIKLPKSCCNPLWSSSGWTWTGYGTLHDALYPKRCNEVIVDYTYGSPPPEMVKSAISTLQCELDKAFAGDDTCRLPERVQSISRQGMDITVLDPQDFLENGKTGIVEVDLAISVFNPTKAKRRARVYSRQYLPGRRLTAGS